MKAVSGVYWDKGGRRNNQDSLLLLQAATRRGRVLMAAVSDGIGGLSQGEVASGFIMEKLTECFYASLIMLIARRKGRRALTRAIERCLYETCGELNRYGREKGIRLGATLSVLLIWKHRYLILHLGDSRIYRFCRKRKRQLTEDHSDGKHGINRCLGSFPFQKPDVRWGRVWGKSGFLLCTDGFFAKSESCFAQVLAPGEIHAGEQIGKRLEMLAQTALRRGEKDNLSALYVLLYGGSL